MWMLIYKLLKLLFWNLIKDVLLKIYRELGDIGKTLWWMVIFGFAIWLLGKC